MRLSLPWVNALMDEQQGQDRVERPTRSANPGSLLSQWWTVGRIICDKRTTGRHVKAAWVIVDRFVRSYGNSRASLRYIQRATGMGRAAVVKACRELTEWGYVERRIGSGTRPSEYAPSWATSPRGTQINTTTPDSFSGVEIHTACGVETHTSRGASGVDSHTESYLLSPAYSPADSKSRLVSATAAQGHSAAPEAGREFDRVWLAYGKYGNKVASRKAFAAINNPDVDLIVKRATAWAASAKPGQRRMPLEKWLAAEKWDEADRRTVVAKPANDDVEVDEDEDSVRKKSAGDDFASAERLKARRRAAVAIDAPHGVVLTVTGAATESRGADTWLAIQTTRGSVAVLVEATDPYLQEEGQRHLARLTDACGGEINEPQDIIGREFVISDASFVAPVEQAA